MSADCTCQLVTEELQQARNWQQGQPRASRSMPAAEQQPENVGMPAAPSRPQQQPSVVVAGQQEPSSAASPSTDPERSWQVPVGRPISSMLVAVLHSSLSPDAAGALLETESAAGEVAPERGQHIAASLPPQEQHPFTTQEEEEEEQQRQQLNPGVTCSSPPAVGKELAAVGEQGEVWVSGPGLAAGYLVPSIPGSPAAAAAQLAQGRFQLLALHPATRPTAPANAGAVASSAGLLAPAAVERLGARVWFNTGDAGCLDAAGEGCTPLAGLACRTTLSPLLACDTAECGNAVCTHHSCEVDELAR